MAVRFRCGGPTWEESSRVPDRRGSKQFEDRTTEVFIGDQEDREFLRSVIELVDLVGPRAVEIGQLPFGDSVAVRSTISGPGRAPKVEAAL
jgi:hypothetical protein